MDSDALFSDSELERYSRHFNLPEFNKSGQTKLKNSKVLIIGAGGLGCPILLYLAAAGVGTIGIVDFDRVDLSNLQRQILFTENDIGKPKAICAAKRLKELNPEIEIIPYQIKIEAKNALEIIEGYDLVADGSDNFPTRYLVNDACVLLNKPNVHGSIFRFEGQVSVFNYQFPEGSIGPNYRDIFPAPPPPELVLSCAEGGVLGVLPGIIGSIQASEIIKVLTGIGTPLAGRILILDALDFETRIMKISKNPNTKLITSLIDYEEFCEISKSQPKQINEISALELKQLIEKEADELQIIDVREPFEFRNGNIGGISIPLAEIENSVNKISQTGKVVFICRSGSRSMKAVKQLEEKRLTNLFNLKGGLLEWVRTVDKEFPLA